MKKQTVMITIILSVMLFTANSISAATLIPRWPQPAWYTQAPQPATQTPETTTAEQQTGLTAAEKTVFDGINHERIKRGLKPLAINHELVRLARLKSKDMGVNQYFAHRSPTYGTAYDMMRQAGVRYTYAGENLARTTSAQRAIELFLNSSTHRSTLLNPNFNQTGVGIYQVGNQLYVTQMFIGVR